MARSQEFEDIIGQQRARNHQLSIRAGSYLEGLDYQLGTSRLVMARHSVMEPIIGHNNLMLATRTPKFENIKARERNIFGYHTQIYIKTCIDGRLILALLGGLPHKLGNPFERHEERLEEVSPLYWRVPAGVQAVDVRPSDLKNDKTKSRFIPESNYLATHTAWVVDDGLDQTELDLIHKGFSTRHEDRTQQDLDDNNAVSNCAAIKEMQLQGIITDSEGVDLLHENRLLVALMTLQSTQNIINTHRERKRRPGYRTLGFVGDLNTDTLGLSYYTIAPYNGSGQDIEILSMPALARRFRSQMEDLNIMQIGQFANIFTLPEHLADFSERIVDMQERLMDRNRFSELHDILDKAFLLMASQEPFRQNGDSNSRWIDLTDDQLTAQKALAIRNMIVMHGTALYADPSLKHTHVGHHEIGMSISVEESLVGQWGFYHETGDLGQIFGSNAADIPTGIRYLRTKLGILRANLGKGAVLPLYICTSLEEEQYLEETAAYRRAKGLSTDVARDIMKDDVIGPEVLAGKIILVVTYMDKGMVIGLDDPSAVM